MAYLLYPHHHFFNSKKTLTPTQLIWKTKVTSTSTALSLTVYQYYTIFKIKRRPFNNELGFWQNLSENRTLLVLIVNNWQLQPMQCSPPQAGLYDMKFLVSYFTQTCGNTHPTMLFSRNMLINQHFKFKICYFGPIY